MTTTPTISGAIRSAPNGPTREALFDQWQKELVEAWRRGARLMVEEVQTPLDPATLTNDEYWTLIVCEIHVRRDIGEHPTYDEYIQRYPFLTTRLMRLFEKQVTQVVRGDVSTLQRNVSAPTLNIVGYELLTPLGRGGMGVVYKARQIGLNRLVALKMILTGRFAGDDELARFRREAEAVAALDHPHIVRVYDISEHEGTPFIALEYVHGGTLAEALRSGPLKPTDAAIVAEAIARGAYEAHRHGIVHRDLKPANILLEKRFNDATPTNPRHTPSTRPAGPVASVGVPKITDFGIAKKLDETHALTASGIAAGTPQYMAPEQAIASKDNPVGGQADVYAIGVILYEMLTGRTPFEGENPVELMQRVVSQAPPSPSRYTPNIPRDLETIVLKCLEKTPSRRYATANDLADDLARWLQGKPITARPVGRYELAWLWCQRNPVVSGLLAGLFLTLFAGVIASTLFAMDARQAAREAKQEKQLARDAEKEAKLKEKEANDNAEVAERNATEARLAQANEAKLRREATRREQRRERELYAADMLVAHADGLSGHLANTKLLLQKYQIKDLLSPDQRGFEWHYINQLTMAYETVFDQIEMRGCVAVPNSTSWAIVGSNYLVLCNPSKQSVVERVPIPLPQYAMVGAVYSPSGEYVACLLDGPELCLYHTAQRKITQRVTLHASPHFSAMQAAFSPDGKTLYTAVGSNHAVSQEGAVLAFDVETGQQKKRYAGLKRSVLSLAVSPDGQTVVASGHDNKVCKWETESGKLTGTYNIPKVVVTRMAFAPQGQLLALGTSEGSVSLIEPSKMQFLRELRGHMGWVRSLEFAHDGNTLASAGNEPVVRVWNARTGEETRACHGHQSRITGLAFGDRSTQLLTTGQDGAALLWNVLQHPQCRTIAPNNRQRGELLPLPDRDQILVMNNLTDYQYLNTRTAELTPPISIKGFNDFVEDAAISADGKTLAICSRYQGCALVSLANPEQDPRLLPNEKGAGLSIALSPNGRWVVVGRRNGEIVIYPTDDLSAGRIVARLRRPVSAIAFPPNDNTRFATASYDFTVRVWETEAGNEELTLQHHGVRPTDLAYSPDGTMFAVAFSDGAAVLYDANTGSVRHRLSGHTRAINHLSFDDRGRRLITCSEDYTLRMWDVETGMATLVLHGHTHKVGGALMRANDRTLVSFGNNEIKLWDARPSRDVEDGRMLVWGTSLKNIELLCDPQGFIHGVVRFRNTSGQPLTVPHSSRLGFGMRLYISVERLGDDATIPILGRKTGDLDQYSIGGQSVMPATNRLQPNEDFEYKFIVPARRWPAGQYRLHLEHLWPGDSRGSNRLAWGSVVVPETK